jgi:methionyl aminopeptidase
LGIYIYNREQISRIKEACMIAAGVLDELEGIIREHVSTHEINSLAVDLIDKAGAKPAFLGYKGYPAAVCASVNEVVVHGIPAKGRRLQDGDIIGIDIGIFYNGYFGDTARTYKIGTVSQEAEQLIDVTRESLYAGIEKCAAGNRISDISHAIEEYVSGFGFTPVREFVGHGIGRNLHEEPSIPNYGPPGSGPRIKDGMVLAVEPMINEGTYHVEVLEDNWTVVTRDRKLSAHFEHTLAIIEGKAEILTRGKNFN